MRLAERLVAPLLDALLIAASLWFMPVLIAPFVVPHWATTVLVLLGYLGMCAGMWLLKLIERPDAPPRPRRSEDDEGDSCLGFLSFSYSVFTLAMLFSALGIAGNEGGIDWQTAPDKYPWAFLIGAILMLVWVCLFPAVALFYSKPVLPPGQPLTLWARIAGVLAVNSMLLLTAAWWQATLGGAEPMGIALGGRILIFVCFYVVFLMCYAAPRLALIAIDGDRLSLYTFLIVLGIIVWPLTA